MEQINEVDLDMSKELLERIEWKLDQVLVDLRSDQSNKKLKHLQKIVSCICLHQNNIVLCRCYYMVELISKLLNDLI